MDGGTWWAAVQEGHEESDTLSDFTFTSLSCTGEGNGNWLQCSCLENPRDRGAWWAAIYAVAESWTRLKRLSSSSNKILVSNKMLIKSFLSLPHLCVCVCMPECEFWTLHFRCSYWICLLRIIYSVQCCYFSHCSALQNRSFDENQPFYHLVIILSFFFFLNRLLSIYT